MIGLDTNILVRYLVQDDPAQAALASREIEKLVNSDDRGFISVIVLAELAWVLKRGYRYTQEEVETAVENILLAREFEVEQRDSAWAALTDYRSTKAGYADCLIGRINHAAGCSETITFDREAIAVPGFHLLEPGSD